MSQQKTNNSNMAMAHPTLSFVSYRLDYALFAEAQRQLLIEYDLSADEREEAKQDLITRYYNMITATTRVLTEHCVCTKCGERPMTSDSRHQFFFGQTETLWRQLEEQIITIERNILTIDAGHFRDLEAMFREVEASYKADNVAASCDGRDV
ncbi:hypothetical protein EG329_006034 [Mollisiaceae sp. DMI_Dod_QoI]|nr:hypothetical protein EG329_006034 [Helotiales sp. DMI_Dod_QoI]